MVNKLTIRTLVDLGDGAGARCNVPPRVGEEGNDHKISIYDLMCPS